MKWANFVYFITFPEHEGRYVKIGKAFDVSSRVKGLQTSSPTPVKVLGVLPEIVESEGSLHKKFSKYRTEMGEWFHLTPHIRHYIKQNCISFNAYKNISEAAEKIEEEESHKEPVLLMAEELKKIKLVDLTEDKFKKYIACLYVQNVLCFLNRTNSFFDRLNNELKENQAYINLHNELRKEIRDFIIDFLDWSRTDWREADRLKDSLDNLYSDKTWRKTLVEDFLASVLSDEGFKYNIDKL